MIIRGSQRCGRARPDKVDSPTSNRALTASLRQAMGTHCAAAAAAAAVTEGKRVEVREGGCVGVGVGAAVCVASLASAGSSPRARATAALLS